MSRLRSLLKSNCVRLHPGARIVFDGERLLFPAIRRHGRSAFAINNGFEHVEHLFCLALAAIEWRRGEAALSNDLTRLAIIPQSSNRLDERWRVTRRHDHSGVFPLDDL